MIGAICVIVNNQIYPIYLKYQSPFSQYVNEKVYSLRSSGSCKTDSLQSNDTWSAVQTGKMITSLPSGQAVVKIKGNNTHKKLTISNNEPHSGILKTQKYITKGVARLGRFIVYLF